MATGALNRTRPRRTPRGIYAAGLLAVLLAALLGAWFISGWHDVRMRQQEATQTLRIAAEQRASDLARELRAELEALMAREGRRPYFHYQNLIHDPLSSPGLNVSPSPLARGSEDKLVLGYFQLDAKGRTTTPTINDEVPKLSEPQRLATNRAFRDDVARDLSRPLAPPRATAPRVAAVTPPRAGDRSAQPASPKLADPKASEGGQQQTQVIKVDPNVYTQNANPNRVYSQQAQVPKPRDDDRQPQPVASPPPAKPAVPVTITISPLEWRTLPFAGKPAFVAVRQVQTPDGALTQGFVVDRAALESWLGSRAGDSVAELHPDLSTEARSAKVDDSRGAVLAPGWSLSVQPNPRTLAQSAADADAVARAFLVRFAGIGSIAVLVAVFVVVLVMRAETLAHERSHFAAAAAHELRTPLAGLQLYGEMLADGLGDPDKMREYARRMSDDASRLGRVVTNVLGFSQLERGSLSVDAHVGPLGDMLRELAERARPTLERAGASLDVDVSPDLRGRFDGDALARIVGNLLDNAEKYTRGADDRTIRLAGVDRGDAVEVSVEDHGPGVRDKTKLFHPFSRGVTSDGPAGLGLGLALSRSLARAMGGELIYRPRDGGGATFVLQLPAPFTSP
jgi:signal transduction histidine kinase